MKKRGVIQKRKERIKKVTDWIVIFVLVIVIGGLIATIIRDCMNIGKWDQGEYHVYNGPCSMEKETRKGRHYSATYIFELGNGDRVTVRDNKVDTKTFNNIENILDAYNAGIPIELTFRYLCFQTVFTDSYEVFSLEDSDGNVYVSDVMMRQSVCDGIGTAMLLCAICLLIPLGYGVLASYEIRERLRKQIRKQKKRIKQENNRA